MVQHSFRKMVIAAIGACAMIGGAARGAPADDPFAAPTRGFISRKQPNAKDWPQAIFTGNGTIGALVMGDPYDETLHLSHSSLFLPRPVSPAYVEMASRLDAIRKLCLDGNFGGAAGQIGAARKAAGNYDDQRDPYIAAFDLRARQPAAAPTRYQRGVDWMTGEASISVADARGTTRRIAFASRADDVLVYRIAGTSKQSAELSFAAVPAANEREQKVIADGIKSSEAGVRDGLLYFRSTFAVQNPFNPLAGYEGFGKVIARGGTRAENAASISVVDADEILVLVKIRPTLKTDAGSNEAAARAQLDALATDYAALLAPHARLHGELMGRVSLSLDAPAADRAKPTEQLSEESAKLDVPLAKIERAFDAGRYNIISCTGLNPPNLQGLWSGSWLAPWSGSYTVNGNFNTAIAFNLTGNTPELMTPVFRFFDERWDGFRANAKAFFGTRGFLVPAQLTVSPRQTDFSPGYPHNYWTGGAAWALESYYDYYRYTGDEAFLADRAYPLMREACAFYEDFLTVVDKDGKLVFVPSFSPENSPGGEGKIPTSINATMDVAACRQLLGNTIAAATHLNRDAELRAKWQSIIDRLPAYEVAPEGTFREWLWPGLAESPAHRHASQLYPLYDERPPEIVDDPALVAAVKRSVQEKLKFRLAKRIGMAFGAVHAGLAAAHVGDAEQTRQVIDLLAKHFWSTGMGSFHDWGSLFNTDISGGFPYLVAQALVYADVGEIRFFPARPAPWTSGSLKGVRLRGGVVVRELTWTPDGGKAVLVSDRNQTVRVVAPDRPATTLALRAGVAATVDLGK